ncbi:2-hydroxychromene-2-carboxylate isomerase [Methanomicrobium sp. W14]|nr:2-hydroxychromene-2-carboxylate isomerase [Methanomicrobium sp. W14]
MTITLPDPVMSVAVILGISGAALVAAKSSQVRRAGFS